MNVYHSRVRRLVFLSGLPAMLPAHIAARSAAGGRIALQAGLLLLALAWQQAAAGSWPMYRHDAQRSAATTEQLAPPLKLSWSYTSPQPPAPAWPDTFPLFLLNRTDFDYAPQLAVAEGIVCFGSSADDTVRALDARTGLEKWHFITGGPVRFAPQIVSNRVYFAADDGYVYCLRADTGRGIWKMNLAPADERFIGNHRMISRWPIRTGVLVADGVLYAVAGMWPAEGTFGYALQADTGKIIWCKDSLGGTPQGALLLSGDVLLIPNGNAKTTPLNRRTGELMRWGSSNEPPGWLAGTYQYIPADPRTGALPQRIYRGGSTGRGGTWVTVDDDKEYSLVQHRPLEVHIEPYLLTNGLAQRGWPIRPQLSIYEFLPGWVHARGKVSAIVHKGRTYTRQAYGMVLSGNNLFLGLDGAVTAESTVKADTNKMGAATTPWQAKVDGEARELAVSDGRLFVATHRGVVYCFEPGSVPTLREVGTTPGKPVASSQKMDSAMASSDKSPALGGSASGGKIEKSKIALLLQQAGMDRGFALVLGDDAGQMSLTLAAQTHLQVINALTNSAAAAALRERLLATTAWHGSRIHVQQVARLDRLPFAQFFANAVIVAGPAPGLSGKELYRVLRPCGGVMLFPGLGKAEAEALIRACDACEAASHAPSLQATTEPTPPSGHPSKEGTARNDPLQRRGGPDALRDRDRGGFSLFVRSQLPGALDWDTMGQIKVDQRVQWPLRHLWFGGPATYQVQEFGEKVAGPTLANGRLFNISEDLLTAVDAYNGTVLWSRPIPKGNFAYRPVAGAAYKVADKGGTYGQPRRGEMVRGLRVSDDYVYLTLGACYFKGKGQGTIQLDARSGEQKQVKVPFNPPVPVLLKIPQSWSLEVDANHSGTLAMAATAQGLVLTLSTVDALVTPLDSWELFFDFRPAAERYGLYEQGVFQIRIMPARDPAGGGTGPATPASWSPITAWSSRDPTAVAAENGPRSPSAATAGSAMPASVGRHSMTAPSVTVPADSTTPLYPQLQVSGTREANGSKTTVTLPWTEIEKLLGAKPGTFDFAAALNAHNGGTNEPIQRRYLFGDWTADGQNNGWAAVALGAAVPATNQPAIMTVASNDKQGNSSGIYAGYGVYASGLSPPGNYAPGTHPLTGESVPRIYWWDPVCGAPEYSAHLVAGRAGVFDLADNSGARVLPLHGIKPGCSTPMAAALGMLLISEETGHCVCNYPFRTTLALAPAERPLNEDWARFYDRDVDTLVRQAHINFGAPGDRRDAQGNLWLRFPRADILTTPEEHTNADHPLPYPVGMRDSFTGLWYHRALRNAMWVPLEVETLAGFEPYRFNTDRFAIRGTERPWIYGSGYRGIRRAALKLNFFKPLAARSVSAPLTVDGKLDESAWQPEMADTNAPPLLPYTATRVFFRYDQRALYLGVQRPPMAKVTATKQANAVALFSRELRPWQTGRSKPDEVAPQDNWWRLIVSDRSLADRGSFAAGKRPPVLYFTVTADGTRAEALGYPPDSQASAAPGGTNAASGGTDVVSKALDWTWNAPWESAGVADPAPGGTGPAPGGTSTNGWTLEMAIPFSTLEQAGLKKERLAVNFLMHDPGVGTEALTYLGLGGENNCSNFTPLGLGAPAPAPQRPFTVRLHFAEPDEAAQPGQRVFDVKLQGQTVLKNFDIVKTVGSPRMALVKEFKNVQADRELVLELVPFARSLTPESVPVLSGLELLEEAPAAGGAVQRGAGAVQQ